LRVEPKPIELPRYMLMCRPRRGEACGVLARQGLDGEPHEKRSDMLSRRTFEQRAGIKRVKRRLSARVCPL